jgi:KUP system potassium uptake protein
VPVPLLHNFKHNKVLHKRIVLLHVVTRNIPRVPAAQRLEITNLADDFHAVVANYGFMQSPNVPRALARCEPEGLKFDMMDTSFFVGRVTIVAERGSRFGHIRRAVFAAMQRNAQSATEFFRIPPNRVIELGGQVEI